MADKTICIAVDAMGGDIVPGVPVEGSLQAVLAYPDIHVSLVGDEKKIKDSLERCLSSDKFRKSANSDATSFSDRMRIVHASEVIGMGESPALATRTKKDASIIVANNLCRIGEAEAVISAGNTGAAMTASLLKMGRLKGVLRPPLMALFPSERNIVAFLDVGANTNCKPEHIYQFAVMASLYTSHVLGYKNPTVGLLSIGEERSKGNELTCAAYELLERSRLNFIGNVEGRDILKGTADVVVCDGFVGNVLLKFGESTFSFITHLLRKKASKSLVGKIGGLMMKPIFREIKKDMNPEYYGGAPLLGVEGVSIICHGNSSPFAIKNAVRVARQLVIEKVNERIKEEFSKENA